MNNNKQEQLFLEDVEQGLIENVKKHIEMKHEWDYLLLAGLDFTNIRFYIASRKIVEELINCNIITGQGKKNDKGIAEAQQAYWFSRSDFSKNNKKFRDYFVPVHNESELISKI